MKRKGVNKAKRLEQVTCPARNAREAEAKAGSDEDTENDCDNGETSAAPSREQQLAGEDETSAGSPSPAADDDSASVPEASEKITASKMATPTAIARVFDIDKDDPDSWCSVGLLTNTECHQTILTDELGIKSFCDLPADEQAALTARLGSDDVQTVCFHHRRFYLYAERHKQGCLDRLYIHQDEQPPPDQIKVTSLLAESCRDVVVLEEGERLCKLCIEEIKNKQECSSDAPSKRNCFAYVLSTRKYHERAKRIDDIVTRCSVGLMTRSLCHMNMNTFEESVRNFSTLPFETAKTLVFRLGRVFDNICMHHERLYLEGYGAPCFDPESKHLSQWSSLQKWLVPRRFSLACRGRYPLRPGRTICIKCLKNIRNNYPEIDSFFKEEEREMQEKLAQLADAIPDDEKADQAEAPKKANSKKSVKAESSREEWKIDARGRRRRTITTVERQLRNLRVENPEYSDVLGSLDTESRLRQKRKVAKVKTFDSRNYNSSSESSAGDDEWRPCRRKIVRRVNPQRSQATKLMWQRKKAAALLLQQQQQEDEYGTGPSSVSGFSSHNQGDSAAILPLSSVGTDPSSTVSAKQSVSTLRMQPPQLPLRKRHIQTRTSDDGGGSSGRTGSSLARTKRMPSVSLWRKRLTKFRMTRFRTRDPLSRAILRRDTARFSMCWSDTTLGSSLAGKSSVRTEDSRSNGSHPASRGGLKAYHHVTCQSATTTTAAASTASVASTPTVTATATTAAAAAAVATAVAAGSSRTGAEVPISQPVINGGNARLGLARACRPKVLKEEPTSSSEHSDDDCAAASLARRYEHLASSPVRQLLEGGPRLRPRLMRTVPPQLGEQEFCVAHSSPIKIEDEPHRSQAMMTVPHHLYRGNSGLKSELLVQGQSVPSTDPCTSKLMPLSSSQCKPWGENLQEHQHALQEEAAADKAQGSSGSVQYARESNGTQQQLPSLLTMSFPFKLPAKLRWKQKMAAERLQGVLPPKLRHKQHMPLWAAGGEADVTANLQAVVKIEPGTAGGAGMLETAPLVPVIKTEHKEPPSERRSQAKRQWWQQVKQLDRLAASGDSTSPEKAEEILSTLPKFLLAELFPDPKTRGKKPKAPVKVEGTPSRRSLIMKESWRRRKAAWLSAAENSLAAAFRPGSTSANKDPTSSGNSSIVVKEEPVEPEEPVPHNSSISGNSGIVVKKEPEEPAVPGEPGPAEESTQYLARTRALRRCRQYRQNLIAQADFQQSSRPLRHYNARGIHITGNKDMCDCLRLECPGCHFPCPKCGSSKCGDECRCNRNYTYEQIEIDGRPGIVYVNPLLS